MSSAPSLVETVVALRVVGRASTVDVLDRIRLAAPELYPLLAEVVDRLPSAVGKVASDVLRELLSEPGGDPRLVRTALDHVRDPRNYRELCDGLTPLLDADDRVVSSLTRALEFLAPAVRRISVLLLSVGRRGEGALNYEDGVLRVGDASMSVNQATDVLCALDGWHRAHAGSAVVSTRVPVQYGADAPQLPVLAEDDPLWMLEERALVLLPGRTGARRNIVVEPVPHELGGPLELERHVRLEFLPGVGNEREAAVRRVVAASLRACSLVLQAPFFSVLDDLSVVVHPDEVSMAYLVAESSTLHVFCGPMGPYVVVHELGHLVDARLARQTAFRSQDPGSALSAFADAARPMYRPVVEARAGTYGRMLADAALPGLPSSGWAPVEEVVAVLPFVLEEDRERVARSVVEGSELPTPEVPDPAFRRIAQVYQALGESLLVESDVPPEGRTWDAAGRCGVVVDLSLLRSELVRGEVDRLLSAPEVFARFFDQYARLLADQKKLAFGPRVRPSDLDFPSVGRLAPLFLDAIFAEQKAYLERRALERGKAQLSDTAVAGITALAGAAVAVFFPEGGRR